MTRRTNDNLRPVRDGLATASLFEIESEVSDVLDVMERIQDDLAEVPGDVSRHPVWQIAEAVKGIAWAVASLARHHEGITEDTLPDNTPFGVP